MSLVLVLLFIITTKNIFITIKFYHEQQKYGFCLFYFGYLYFADKLALQPLYHPANFTLYYLAGLFVIRVA